MVNKIQSFNVHGSPLIVNNS